MFNRDTALAAVRHHVGQVMTAQDVSGLLGPSAMADVELLKACTDPGTDLDSARALGIFHWFRYLSMSDDAGEDELAAAVRYLAPIFECLPAAVPEALRAFYQQDNDQIDDIVDAVIARGSEVFADFRRTGDRRFLAEAVAFYRAAGAATPVSDARFLSGFAAVLGMLFDNTGHRGALREAVRVGRASVAATQPDDPSRAGRLHNLGHTLRVLFESTGQESALTEALRAARAAVAATPVDDPDHARYLNGLGAALRLRTDESGSTAALAEVVRICRAAALAAPAGHRLHAMCLQNLGNSLQALFDRTGRDALLDEAVRTARAAVAAGPAGRPDRAGYLNTLHNALLATFERTGAESVLEEAVDVGRAVVAGIADGDRHRAGCLSNLGFALRALSVRTGRYALLVEGVDVTRVAVAAVAVSHPDRAMFRSNLGLALHALFEHDRRDALLAEAVEHLRSAVDDTPAGHPRRVTFLNNLGLVRQSTYQRTGQLTALTEAVECYRAAVAATPADHPDRAVRLSNLGATLQLLFARTMRESLLAEAIQAGRAAVAATAGDHPDRAPHLVNLGHALWTSADTAAVDEAGRCFAEAGDNEGAPAWVRIRALRARAALPGGSPLDVLEAMEAAVGLLPRIAPRTLIRADRRHGLGTLAAMAGQAAAAATGAGRPDRAVELLEQTRGVLVAEILDARCSDLSRLRERAPDLAEAFEELRARIDAMDHSADIAARSANPVPDQAHARRDAQLAWDELVTDIGAIDGFQDFLRIPDIRQLAAYADSGPVVFVYTSVRRCDALILANGAVLAVPLTGLTEADAVGQTNRLLAARHTARHTADDSDVDPETRIAAQADILDILGWLWDVIAEPVLAALGRTVTPTDQPWPRLHWCPIGILAYLPLHAAGHHDDRAPNPRTVLDRVQSSYTTTLRGLAYARTHQYPAATTALIVAVPDAPDVPSVPGALAEAIDVARLLPGAQVMINPAKDMVLTTLPDHSVAHFACHGRVDRDDPTGGRLVLPDHLTAPLTVADISALRLTGALAYLSVCDTSVTDPALTDEAVHITGAFHLAGYCHVIGTLWRVDDTAARDIAHDFYDHLTAGGTNPPDTTLTAQALHHAVRRARDRYPATPTLWAAHTHTGC